MGQFLTSLFGLHLPLEAITIWHLLARGFAVYLTGMVLVRWQAQFMGINTPFTYMLNYILGSLLADAIVGEGSFLAIVGMCLVIAWMNWFIALLCFYFPMMDVFFRGERDVLVKNGIIQWKAMRRNLITQDELMESVHKYTQSNDLSRVKQAYFENSGEITIITK
jgi:uncharacterized membrane protein YcaP (DUF421 family)